MHFNLPILFTFVVLNSFLLHTELAFARGGSCLFSQPEMPQAPLDRQPGPSRQRIEATPQETRVQNPQAQPAPAKTRADHDANSEAKEEVRIETRDYPKRIYDPSPSKHCFEGYLMSDDFQSAYLDVLCAIKNPRRTNEFFDPSKIQSLQSSYYKTRHSLRIAQQVILDDYRVGRVVGLHQNPHEPSSVHSIDFQYLQQGQMRLENVNIEKVRTVIPEYFLSEDYYFKLLPDSTFYIEDINYSLNTVQLKEVKTQVAVTRPLAAVYEDILSFLAIKLPPEEFKLQYRCAHVNPFRDGYQVAPCKSTVNFRYRILRADDQGNLLVGATETTTETYLLHVNDFYNDDFDEYDRYKLTSAYLRSRMRDSARVEIYFLSQPRLVPSDGVHHLSFQRPVKALKVEPLLTVASTKTFDFPLVQTNEHEWSVFEQDSLKFDRFSFKLDRIADRHKDFQTNISDLTKLTAQLKEHIANLKSQYAALNLRQLKDHETSEQKAQINAVPQLQEYYFQLQQKMSQALLAAHVIQSDFVTQSLDARDKVTSALSMLGQHVPVIGAGFSVIDAIAGQINNLNKLRAIDCLNAVAINIGEISEFSEAFARKMTLETEGSLLSEQLRERAMTEQIKAYVAKVKQKLAGSRELSKIQQLAVDDANLAISKIVEGELTLHLLKNSSPVEKARLLTEKMFSLQDEAAKAADLTGKNAEEFKRRKAALQYGNSLRQKR